MQFQYLFKGIKQIQSYNNNKIYDMQFQYLFKSIIQNRLFAFNKIKPNIAFEFGHNTDGIIDIILARLGIHFNIEV